MVAFLHQLKILLWKNWLSALRQPIWSCVLIIWPVVIFIILAITRVKFPPEPVANCYLAPRNLPSTGLVPFLQTFFCTNDGSCKNQSYLEVTSSNTSSTSNADPSSRMQSVPSSVLAGKQAEVDQGGDQNPLLAAAEEEAKKEPGPGPVLHRGKRDTGRERSSIVPDPGQIAAQNSLSGVLKILLCNLTWGFVPATNNDSAIQSVGNILTGYCTSDQSLMGATVQELSNNVLPLLDDPENQILLLSGLFSGLAKIKIFQNATTLWDALFILPELFIDPKSALPQTLKTLNRQTRSVRIFQDTEGVVSCLEYPQNLGQASNSTNKTSTSTSTGEDLGGCMSLLQKFTCDSAPEQCWPQLKQYLERAYWMVTHLNNTTDSIGCTFNISTMEVVCKNSTIWQQVFQNVVTTILETMKNHTALQRIFGEAWTVFRQNDVESLLSERLREFLASQYPYNQKVPALVASLLQLLFNVTDEFLPEVPVSSAFYNSSASIGIIHHLLEKLWQIALQDAGLENLRNMTQVWNKILQAFFQDFQLFNDLSMGTLFPQNATDPSIMELETLIAHLASMSDGSFNMSSTIIKIVHVLNKPEFLQLMQTSQDAIQENHSLMQVSSALLEALQTFNHILRTNSTASIHIPADVYLEQVLNYLRSDHTLQRILFIFGPYFNITAELPFLHVDEMRAIAGKVLSFLPPPNLLNVSTFTHSIPSALVTLFSEYITEDEKALVESAANTILVVMESVQMCETRQSNCSRYLDEFQQLLGDIVQFLTKLENNSLEEKIDKSSLLHCTFYNETQVSLVNSIFYFLWSSKGKPIHSEIAFSVFEKVLSARDFILNITTNGNLNLTLVESFTGSTRPNTSELNTILEVFASSNASEFLLQIQNVLLIPYSNNHTESSSVLCTLNLALRLTGLLQRLHLPKALQDRLAVVTSVITFWMRGIREAEVTKDQQLHYVYNLTMIAFENEPLLSLMHSAVSAIVENLNSIQANLNTSILQNNTTIRALLEMLQPQEFGISLSNMSAGFFLPTKDQLEKMEAQLQIVKWYTDYAKNKSAGLASSEMGYSWYSLAQLILSNTLTNIQNDSPVHSLLTYTQILANSLNQSHSYPTFLNILIETLRNSSWEFQQFINYTEIAIHMLFPNETDVSSVQGIPWKEGTLHVVGSALKLLQEYSGNSFTSTNTSLGFQYTQTFLEMLNYISRMLRTISTLNHIVYPDCDQDTSQKASEILKEGIHLINHLGMGGAPSQEDFYAIYNFSHLLFGNVPNGISSLNASSLNTKLVDSSFLLLKVFLQESHENGSNPMACPSRDVLHLAVDVIFRNISLHESLLKTGCRLSFVFQYLENGTLTNKTLEEILHEGLEIIQMAEDLVERYNNETSYKAREQAVCILCSLHLSTNFLSKMNALEGHRVPWLQHMHETLTLITEQLTKSNITCVALEPPVSSILDNLIQNQSNMLHFTFSLILNQIDLYAQGAPPNISASDLMLFFSLLPNSESWKGIAFELLQAVLNPPKVPALDLFTRARVILDHFSHGNWNMTEVSELLELFEILIDSFNLTGSSLGPEVVEAHQFLADILKGVNSPVFSNLSSSTLNLDPTAVSQCRSLVEILASASENILKDLKLIPTNWVGIGLTSNISLFACDLLLSNYSHFNWAEEVRKAETIISYITPFAPAGTAKYLQAAGKILPELTNLLLKGSLTSNYSVRHILEMLTPFLELYEETKVIGDVLANPSLQNLLSGFFKMATAGGNGSQIHAAQEATVDALDFIHDTLAALNFSSYAATVSRCSEIIKLLFNYTDTAFPMGNSVVRFLNELWIISQESGLETLLNTQIKQLISSQHPSEPDLPNLVTSLFHLLLDLAGQALSTASSSHPDMNGNTSEIIKSLLDSFQQRLLQEPWPSNSNNHTQALAHMLQTIITRSLLWEDFSINYLFPQNETSQSLVVLERLIQGWISIDPVERNLAFNYSTTVIKIFSILNQSDFGHLPEMLLNVFKTNQSSTEMVPTLLESIRLLIQVMRKNSTIPTQVLSEVYLKLVLNYLSSDLHLQRFLLILNPYFNLSREILSLNLDELSNISAEVLSFLEPLNLQNVCRTGSRIPSAVLTLFSNFIPQDDQEVFHGVANATLQLLNSMQMCKNQPSNCSHAIEEFQLLLAGVVNFLKAAQSGRLEENYDTGLFLHFGPHNDVQISLIESVFGIILYSSGSLCHARTATGVYERLLLVRNLILNHTVGTDVNASIASLLSGADESGPSSILQVFTSSNITELLLQLQAIIIVTDCTNHTETTPLLCTLDVTFHLMRFLQNQQLPKAINQRITLVTSIIAFWMEQIKGIPPTDQDIIYCYEFTKFALQNNSILYLIKASIFDVAQTLKEIQTKLNTSSAVSGILKDLFEITQPNGSVRLKYNVSGVSSLPIIDQMETVKVKIQIAQWFIVYVNNLVEGRVTIQESYPLYRITQLLLAEVIANMKDDLSFAPIFTFMNHLVDAFSQSHSPAELLNTVKLIFEEGNNLVDNFIHLTHNILHMLFPNQTETLPSWPTLLNEDFQKAMQISLNFAQEYSGQEVQAATNMSMILESINRALELLIYIQERFAMTDLENLQLTSAQNGTLQKAYEILHDGTSILWAVDQEGLTQEMIHRIYNFSHLLCVKGSHMTSLQNSFTLEANIVNLVLSAISPFLGESNNTQGNPGTCSAKDALHTLFQMIFQNQTLSESLEQAESQMPFQWLTFENCTLLNTTAEHVLHLMKVIRGSSNEFSTQFDSAQSDSIKERLACTIKSLHLSIGFLSQLNTISKLHISWVQSLHEMLASISKVLAESNKTCDTGDSPIFNTIDSIFNNQTSRIYILIHFIFNHSRQYSEASSSSEAAWEAISKFRTLFNSLYVFPRWNSTIDHLLQVALNVSRTSADSPFPTLWHLIDNLRTLNWSRTELNASINILETMKTVLALGNSRLGSKMIATYQALVDIFREANASGSLNLTSPYNTRFSPYAVTNCQSLFREAAQSSLSIWKAANLSVEWMADDVISSLALLTCRLLNANQSGFSWAREVEIIDKMIFSLTSLTPVGTAQYFNSSREFISALTDLLMINANTTVQHALAGVAKVLLPLLNVMEEKRVDGSWTLPPGLHGIYYFLLNLVKNAATTDLKSTPATPTVEAPQVLEALGKTLEAPSYTKALTSASEMLQLLQDSTSETSARARLAEQFLNLEEPFKNVTSNQSSVSPYRSLLSCLENVTSVIANQSRGDLEEVFQLIQDVFAQNYTFEDSSLVPEILGLKISQLQNLTSLLCEPGSFGSGEEACRLPCQYILQVLNTVELGIKLPTESKTASGIMMRAAPGTAASNSSTTGTFLDTILQNIASEINSINWVPSNLIPTDILQNMTQYLSLLGKNITLSSLTPQVKVANLFGDVIKTKKELNLKVGLPLVNIDAMMDVNITNTTFQMIAWFRELNKCSKDPSLVPEKLQVFCTMPALQGYQMAIVLLQNLDVFSFAYRMYLPQKLQDVIDIAANGLVIMNEALNNVTKKLPPIQEVNSMINQAQSLINLVSAQMRQMQGSRRAKRATSSTAIPLSIPILRQVLCTKNIPLLFAYIAQLPPTLTARANTSQDQASEDLINKYGIPPSATAFCKNILVSLVNSTNGAFYWVFLKPMLYGKILYTPHTPETEAIMTKAMALLDEMQQLKSWADKIGSLSAMLGNYSSLITQIAPLLNQVQNYLRNPFVQVLVSVLANANATEIYNQIQALKEYASLLQDNQGTLATIMPLIKLFANLGDCFSYDRLQSTNSTESLDATATQLRQQNTLFAGVIFDIPASGTRRRRAATDHVGLPKQVKYTIRMNIMLSQPTSSIRDAIWVPGPHQSSSKYLTYGRAFIFLQDTIERAIVEMQTNMSLSDIAVQFQPMPYACYTKDNFLYSVSFALPIVLMVAWVLFIAAFVKRLVLEKDLRLHEYMKMMGVSSCSHFFAWFIESAIFLLITVFILVIILTFGGILPSSNGGIIFLFLVDYSLSIIAMSYLISVFFHNTNIAALSGSLIYIISFFPFIVMTSRENSLSFAGKTLLGLFSPTALSYATQYVAYYESQGAGIQWSNMYLSPLANDTCSFSWMCWLLLIDSAIYFVVGWYIRMVFPGKYGIGVPWYFLFLPSFWKECCGLSSACAQKRASGLMFTNIMVAKARASQKKDLEDSTPEHALEAEPTHLTVGVSLHGLSKIYNSKTAVDNLNLNFYEGHITSLLGHNGAGKTTTISMLTGLFSATSGTINVYGEDIRTHLDHIRKSMGVCMQYDVLFPHLTTKEHLLLYGAIKAPHWSNQQLHGEVKRTLKDTGLYNHRKKSVGALSGGMRRKLSICIALIGGSKVIILDEPTTGVDPCSRRAIWEIISKHKRDKTIILSTHHLDEAEVLSDRIAFLENGGLKCCGSPFFLKEKYGEGYHLTLTKKIHNRNNDRECDTEAVTTLIKSHIPEAYLKSDVGEELVYVLPPFNAGISNAYLSLLRSLDTSMNNLHIGCYGISDTTVEEVFLKLMEGLDADENDWSRTKMVVPITATDELMVHDDTSTSSYSFRDDQALTRTKKVGGAILLLKKMSAIFIKRFHNSRRNWKGLISQILLPVLFVIAAMGLGSLSSGAGNYQSLELSPALYGSSNQSVAFGNSNSSTEDLVNTALSYPGIDNSCLKSPQNCLTASQLGEWTSAGNESGQYGSCNCTKTTQVCQQPINAAPSHRKTFSGQTVYNLTGYNMENYLLTTTNSFIQSRYGAWSYGLPLSSDLLFDSQAIPPNRTMTKVWYNPEGYHTLPAYLNSLNNFILRANLPHNVSSQYGIFVSTHPYPGALTMEQNAVGSMVNILVALCILVGYSITTASFVTYIVKEHQNGSKRLQHISGISEPCYWITNFLYDMLLYMVPVALSIATIAGFKLPAFYDNQNLGAVSLLFTMFGFATFAWMYLLAGTFKNLGMAFIVYVCINLFIGINTIISATVVDFLGQDTSLNATDAANLRNISFALESVFKIFPQFCFGYGLIELSKQQVIADSYSAYGYNYPISVFDMDILGWMFVSLAGQGVFFFGLRLLSLNSVFQNIKRFVKGAFILGIQPVASNLGEDQDVQAERTRVESSRADTDLLQLHGLTKIYHQLRRNVVAVNDMTVGIRPGECFGLLGVNGAGKTTTFKMLTGDILPSRGKIQIRDKSGNLVTALDCDKDWSSYSDWSSFGYCPQEDALDDLLTGEEHMYYYARIHGIPEKRIKVVSMPRW
ncbi:glucosylceramide transporter ABCA12 isoform X2 [Ambystoma mexicanum]|uniref:glucosylceramide transporter ABCA12 isoform X2 n=1 Tax=Ambystoma mexicanum TaxID=8296 RepID=UPI0037E740C3